MTPLPRLCLAAASVAAALMFALRPPTDAAEPEPPVGPTLHEWGVFQVYEDSELANAEMKAEWNGLPKFVYGRLPGRHVPYNGPVLKPVIYVHTPKPISFDIKIDFPGGAPAVWYPATESPNSETLADTLHWKVHAREMPAVGGRVAPALQPVPEGHWLNDLRKTDSAAVFVAGGRIQIQPGRRWEQEKFLYYDGLIPAITGLKVTRAEGKTKVANTAAFALFDVFVMDRAADGSLLAVTLDKLEPGASTQVELKAADAAKLAADLTARVKAAGLNADEAEGLAKIWKMDFFESDGPTAIVRIPQTEYDKRLPATVTPKPQAFVRVGLVQYRWADPALEGRVAELVKQLDAEGFAAREAAQKRLGDMGRAALPYLRRSVKVAKSAEVQSRLSALLSRYEAELPIRKR